MKKLTGQQLRTLQIVEFVGTLIDGIALMFSAYSGHWLFWPAVIVLIGLVAVDLILFRCPHCERHLRYFPLTEERCFCPHCGKELD